MMKEIQELQKQSNAAIKRARVAAILPKELDEVLSMLNARLRNLENIVQYLEAKVNRVPGSIPGELEELKGKK